MFQISTKSHDKCDFKYDFFERSSKFRYQLLLVNICKCVSNIIKIAQQMKNLTFGELRGRGTPISKIWKIHIQNGGPIAHRKFQHSSLIRKGLKNGGTEIWGERRHPRSIFGNIQNAIRKHNIRYFDTRIFAIRSRVLTKAMEALKTDVYGWLQCKK